MELNVYGVIRKVIMTSKSWHTFQTQHKLTFEVERSVNKSVVRDAVEKIWDVKVEKVNIINTPDHSGVFARRKYVRPGNKRAIVTLKPGYKIDMPGEMMSAGSMESHSTSVENEG
jgi:large subunit ribosomal protein L23